MASDELVLSEGTGRHVLVLPARFQHTLLIKLTDRVDLADFPALIQTCADGRAHGNRVEVRSHMARDGQHWLDFCSHTHAKRVVVCAFPLAHIHTPICPVRSFFSSLLGFTRVLTRVCL